VVMDNEGTKDWAADYDGEGDNGGERCQRSGVAMMAARVEDGGGRQRQQRQKTAVVDDDGSG
jgi:hypothetical protein